MLSHFSSTGSLALVLFASLVYPNCPMDDVSGAVPGAVSMTMKEPTLCQPTGAGTLTFGMSSSMSATFFGVTTPDGQWPEGTISASGATFYIMDNSCKVLGIYQPSDACNVPEGGQYIMANFLQYVLTLQSMDSGVSLKFEV
jgi:hypothetical protein